MEKSNILVLRNIQLKKQKNKSILKYLTINSYMQRGLGEL